VLLANLVVLLEGLSVSVASVFFPVMAGVAILSGTALAALGGERPSRLVYAGSALAVLAIVLVNVGRPLVN